MGDDLRVLVVAQDPLARAGLATLLSDQQGCTLVGQVDGGADLVAGLEVYRPQVLVWDLGWEPAQALERLTGLPEGSPPVVALLPDDAHVATAWAAGARGLVLRDADASSIAAAAIAVARGVVALDPRLAAGVLASRGRPPAMPASELTPRESQVLRLLAQGLPNKAIAGRLGISEHTVKFHVNAIFSKLGAQSRTEAVVQATRLGLVPL
jgi:DNA-binding NarL/FixJ family response regulator